MKLTPDQEHLLALGNEVTRQLKAGRVNRDALLSAIPADETEHAPLQSFSSAFEQGLPPMPKGVVLRSLPELTAVSGGLMGLWVIAGETGVGKTTVALQCALDYSQHENHSVLLYDYENGPDVTAHHVGAALGSAKLARERTERWYYRESIYSFQHDLGLCTCEAKAKRAHGTVPQPALIVVDSFQTLAQDDAYHVLGRWLRVFERLARVGYSVLLLSEKPRYQYGKARTSGFADVRAEYKAWFGVQLLEDRHGLLGVHVVKNRHRPHLGHVLDLRRDKAKVWLFKETGTQPSRDEEDEEL